MNTNKRKSKSKSSECRVKGLLHFREDFNDFACSCQGQLTTGTLDKVCVENVNRIEGLQVCIEG